jgi:prevent-host-death family protein
MTTVGAFEAKTHFSALLERAAQGEEIVITRHGRAVARLVPVAASEEEQVEQAIAVLKNLRRGTTLGGLSWQELRDEGRR